MPRLRRPDGAELHWEERGEGPLVVLVPYWTGYPRILEPITVELGRDHRVVRFDARGTGRSTRNGPYDMSTGADDLAATIEAMGDPAVVVTLGDGCNRAVRVAAGRPDLVTGIVAPGAAPVGIKAFAGTEALVSSDTVIGAFVDMVDTDYRGALRSVLTAANPQMSEQELRERVREQAEYRPREVALEMLRTWVADDPTLEARETGDRLWLLFSPNVPNPWFPGNESLPILRKLLPEAHLEEVEDGMVSRPDLTADVVRRITAPLRARARAGTDARQG